MWSRAGVASCAPRSGRVGVLMSSALSAAEDEGCPSAICAAASLSRRGDHVTTPPSTFDPTAPEDVLGRVQDTVKAWIQECTGIKDVPWHNEPQGNFSITTQARVNLTMRNVVDVGQDEMRREANQQNL